MNTAFADGPQLSDCYRILHVNPKAGWKAVRRSYRALARQHHPDLNPGGADQAIREITQAYRILQMHYRATGSGEKGRLPPENFTPPVPRPEGPLIRRILHGALHRSRWFKPGLFGLDVEKDLVVSSAFAAHGGKVRVRQGGGSFHVNLPAGGWRRLRLRVPGRGESGLLGKKRGDLLLNVRVREEARANSREAVYHHEFRVPRTRIAEGRVLTLETGGGPIKFFLPRSTRDGETFVLKSSPGRSGALVSHMVTVRLI